MTSSSKEGGNMMNREIHPAISKGREISRGEYNPGCPVLCGGINVVIFFD